MNYGFWVVAILCFFPASCTSPAEEAEKAVRAYNKALVLAYRTGDMTELEKFAGDNEVRKIRVLMDLKRSQGMVLESTLESLKVVSSQTSGTDSILVETKERWRYQDRMVQPGKPPGQLFVSEMNMEYTCEKESDQWKVTELRTKANRVINQAGKVISKKT